MTPSERERAREIVNNYEDQHKHLRGYYSRIDLLSVAEAARREERKRTLEIAQEVAEEVGGKFWETHMLNSGLLKFINRIRALDKETA